MGRRENQGAGVPFMSGNAKIQESVARAPGFRRARPELLSGSVFLRQDADFIPETQTRAHRLESDSVLEQLWNH